MRTDRRAVPAHFVGLLWLSGSLAVAAMTNTADAATIRGRDGKRYTVDAKAAALFDQGGAAMAKKDYGRAISYFTGALQTKAAPEAAAAIYDMRAAAYVDKAELERAMQDANECIRLNPRFFGGYQSRGRVYRRRGEHDKAIREYTKALQLDPNFAQLYVNRGVAYTEKGDAERAMREFNEAIRRNPSLSEAYGNRGILYYTKGQFDKAPAEYNKAMRLDRTEELYYNRALLFKKMGRLDNALADCNEAIRRNPNSPDGYLARAKVHATKRAYRQTLADLERAAQLRPNGPDVLNDLAWLKATWADDSVREGKEAVRIAVKACQLSKWNVFQPVDTLAAAYAEQGDFEKAVEYQTRALKLAPVKSDEREGMQERLRLYRASKPFREVASK